MAYSLYPAVAPLDPRPSSRNQSRQSPQPGSSMVDIQHIIPRSPRSPLVGGQPGPMVPTMDRGASIAYGEPLAQDFAIRHIAGVVRPVRSNGSMRSLDSVGSDPLDSLAASHPKHIAALQSDMGTHPHAYHGQGFNGASNNHKYLKRFARKRENLGLSSVPTTPDSRERSSAESVISYDTSTSSIHNLPALQEKNAFADDHLTPVNEDDPKNFDLLEPADLVVRGYSLEQRSEQMFSTEHLQEIFADPSLLTKFTNFLHTCRPQSIPLLVYYLNALKALRAINYANSLAENLESLQPHEFSHALPPRTVNSVLEEKARLAFDALVRDELPAYITNTFIQVATISIQRRITGTLPPHLREASEGLAEVFCLTDPSRPDNPIVFASEEFHKTSQYGVSYAIGRNCRFLQGPRTNRFSVERLKRAIADGREVSEVFLNYRRDGSPFMNLLMIAPLLDSRGNIRYFIGAQVDVSGLVKDCTGLEGLQRMLAKLEDAAERGGEVREQEEKKPEFQELSEMLNSSEVETVRKFGGRMHSEQIDEADEHPQASRPRLLLKDPNNDLYKQYQLPGRANGKLEGIYQHYLLVRPYPSLRILFVSPSLRVPGILQSPLLSRIGGSQRVHQDLIAALAEGRGVTAKVRWVSGRSGDEEGRPRWMHCTPLLGHTGAVGVWMIVLVDEADAVPPRRFRMAPPVAQDLGGMRSPGPPPVANNRTNEYHRPIGGPADQRRAGTPHPVMNTTYPLRTRPTLEEELNITAANQAYQQMPTGRTDYPRSPSSTRPSTRNGMIPMLASTMEMERDSTSSTRSFALG